MTKVGIIGYGTMGKRYHKVLSNNSKFEIKKILRKKKTRGKLFTTSQKDFFNNKIDLFIIATKVKSHYHYIKKVCLKKKNIIIEKPFVKNIVEAKKLQKYKNINSIKKLLVHHNDIYNLDKLRFSNILKKIGKIREIEFFYGKDQKGNFNQIVLDWLPHPISVLMKFFGRPLKIYLRKFDKNSLVILFKYSYFKARINISKNYPIKKKIINFYGSKKNYSYDGYSSKFNSLRNLIDYYSKTKRANDLDLSVGVTNMIDKIQKKFKKT